MITDHCISNWQLRNFQFPQFGFNIPNPYLGSDVVGVPKIRRPKFTLGEFIKPQTVASQAPCAITYDESFSSSKADRQSEKLEKTSESGC